MDGHFVEMSVEDFFSKLLPGSRLDQHALSRMRGFIGLDLASMKTEFDMYTPIVSILYIGASVSSVGVFQVCGIARYAGSHQTIQSICC